MRAHHTIFMVNQNKIFEIIIDLVTTILLYV